MTGIDTLIAENTALKEKLQQALERLDQLSCQLQWFQRQLFNRKSERFIPVNPLQTSLDLGLKPSQAAEAKTITIKEFSRKNPKANTTPHSREEIPAHLPRNTIIIQPDFDTSGMVKVYDKITEELEMQPPKFLVTQYVRGVYESMVDGQKTLRCPTLPPRCIDKGKAGPGLVAQTIISKCVDHIPHFRFVKMINRECRMNLPESTVHDWFTRGVFWLEPIVTRCSQLLQTSHYQQMDETKVVIMIQPTGGKSTRGFMILQLAVLERIVVFTASVSRTEEVLTGLVGNFCGLLQTDGLEQYRTICKNNPQLIPVGCMDHCRRGFDKALTNDKARSEHVLNQLKLLYAVEEQARQQNLDFASRLQLRQEKSKPVFDQLYEWMGKQIAALRQSMPIAKAINYALERKKELGYFLTDGRVEISSILVENQVRPFALGRKNFLFAGSLEGAQRLAVAYSVLGTCVLNKVNPSEYLPSVFKELPRRKANDIDDLLPMNWKPSQ